MGAVVDARDREPVPERLLEADDVAAILGMTTDDPAFRVLGAKRSDASVRTPAGDQPRTSGSLPARPALRPDRCHSFRGKPGLSRSVAAARPPTPGPVSQLAMSRCAGRWLFRFGSVPRLPAAASSRVEQTDGRLGSTARFRGERKSGAGGWNGDEAEARRPIPRACRAPSLDEGGESPNGRARDGVVCFPRCSSKPPA